MEIIALEKDKLSLGVQGVCDGVMVSCVCGRVQGEIKGPFQGE